MGKKVFANGMAIAAKAGDGKLIAAFPDVCNSPPSPPTGPIPLPYPNSAFSKDLKEGAKSVRIGGKPAALEDSYLKTSPLGNEAATKSFGGSLITHTTTGKAYFAAHSMDVMIEGKGVVRHLDLMTSNHGSYPGGTPPFAEMEEMALLALADKTDLCPCCMEATCSAALSKDLEPAVAGENGAPGTPAVPRTPLSFREFYNLDEVDAAGALTAKAASRRAALAGKPCSGGACPNAGKALPKSDPPCDVYRVLSKAESDTNYNSLKDPTKRELRVAHGVPPSKDALAQKLLGNPFTNAASLRAAGWSDEQMNKKIQIDHATPRAAGGCPTSMGNTAAHDKKCSNCKSIDGDLDTWSGQELVERRGLLGI